MSDNLPLLAAKDIGDVLYPRNIITDPSGADITPLTDAQLRATPLSVEVRNFPSTSTGLTNDELRATPLTVTQPGSATEATLLALNTAIATLNGAAAAIRTAVESLNGKTVAVNTGAVAGTVELGAASLAALEQTTVTVGNFPSSQNVNTGLSQPLTDAQLRATSIPVTVGNFPTTQTVSGNVSTGLAQPLTDMQLRATAVPVVASVLPLPTGAATEATLVSVSEKLPPLSAGRIPVELPAGEAGLTEAQYRAAQAETVTKLSESVAELALAVRRLQVVAPLPDPAGRVRAAIETGSLSSVSTVSAVTNINGFAGYSPATMPFSVMQCAVNGLRAKIDLS